MPARDGALILGGHGPLRIRLAPRRSAAHMRQRRSGIGETHEVGPHPKGLTGEAKKHRAACGVRWPTGRTSRSAWIVSGAFHRTRKDLHGGRLILKAGAVAGSLQP